MEKAIRFTTAARLPAVGVIGFVPTAHSYRPYPAGSYASKPSAMWRKNPPIHSAMGNKTPNSLH